MDGNYSELFYLCQKMVNTEAFSWDKFRESIYVHFKLKYAMKRDTEAALIKAATALGHHW